MIYETRTWHDINLINCFNLSQLTHFPLREGNLTFNSTSTFSYAYSLLLWNISQYSPYIKIGPKTVQNNRCRAVSSQNTSETNWFSAKFITDEIKGEGPIKRNSLELLQFFSLPSPILHFLIVLLFYLILLSSPLILFYSLFLNNFSAVVHHHIK